MSKSIRLVVAFECDQDTADEMFDVQPQTKDQWVSFLLEAFQDQVQNDITDPIVQVVDWTADEVINFGTIDEALDETGWVS